jgi:hypothetical protein
MVDTARRQCYSKLFIFISLGKLFVAAAMPGIGGAAAGMQCGFPQG